MINKIKLARQTKDAFKKIEREYDLVNFGDVDPRDAEHAVKGFTFFPRIKDEDLLQGTIGGLDLSIVQREAELTYPKHNNGTYRWTIVKVDLNGVKFPHIFVDSGKYDQVVYKNIFTKFARFSQNNHVLAEGDFKDNFNLFCAPDNANVAEMMFPDQILEHIYYNYPKFDIELEANSIYIYSNTEFITYPEIKKMIGEAEFLANHFYEV